MGLILLIFLSAPGLAWQAALKKKVKLDLLTDMKIKNLRDKKFMIKIKNLHISGIGM